MSRASAGHHFRRVQRLLIAGPLLCSNIACTPGASPSEPSTSEQSTRESAGDERIVADVVSVEPSGADSAYRFDVGIKSPDLGCDQYADWWEVLSQDGRLIYRRVLGHSHVGEQPFVRSGSPVEVAARDVVWVRAHMHPTGYGGMAFKGSVEGGFEATSLEATFAAALAGEAPLPPPCAR